MCGRYILKVCEKISDEGCRWNLKNEGSRWEVGGGWGSVRGPLFKPYSPLLPVPQGVSKAVPRTNLAFAGAMKKLN